MSETIVSPFDPRRDALFRRAMDSALRILSRRDHSCRELSFKLRRKGIGPAVVDAVIARCLDMGYLDDARTADVLAGHLVARGYGPLRIRQILGHKGLDDVLVERALKTHCGERVQADQALRMLDKRRAHLRREPDAIKRRQKAFRYLAGRGFTADIVRRVIDDV